MDLLWLFPPSNGAGCGGGGAGGCCCCGCCEDRGIVLLRILLTESRVAFKARGFVALLTGRQVLAALGGDVGVRWANRVSLQ